jgi:hypothetical protein
MLDKTKVSRMIKIQILSFMTLTLFACILGDSIYLSKYARDMLDRTKVSCLVKIHILSFMTPTLFVRIKEKNTKRVTLCIPLLIRSIKTLLFEYPDIFGI